MCNAPTMVPTFSNPTSDPWGAHPMVPCTAVCLGVLSQTASCDGRRNRGLASGSSGSLPGLAGVAGIATTGLELVLRALRSLPPSRLLPKTALSRPRQTLRLRVHRKSRAPASLSR